jgi:hypothetical protein
LRTWPPGPKCALSASLQGVKNKANGERAKKG